MARAATQMVNDAIDAYVNDDENLARKVISSDDKIDELFVKTKDKIIDEIAADKANSEKAIDTLMVAKYFERIGDHAVNIAEWVVFSVTGVHKTERHHVKYHYKRRKYRLFALLVRFYSDFTQPDLLFYNYVV